MKVRRAKERARATGGVFELVAKPVFSRTRVEMGGGPDMAVGMGGEERHLLS